MGQVKSEKEYLLNKYSLYDLKRFYLYIKDESGSREEERRRSNNFEWRGKGLISDDLNNLTYEGFKVFLLAKEIFHVHK